MLPILWAMSCDKIVGHIPTSGLLPSSEYCHNIDLQKTTKINVDPLSDITQPMVCVVAELIHTEK